MAIREDVVASAVKFLQDPSVASSPVENRIAFLQAKNLTQDEVNAALARAAGEPAPVASYPGSQPPTAISRAQQPQYYAQYPPYSWQPPPPELPRRDWRDWFIMATLMSGVTYGAYTLAKRYIIPLVAPPTPERLEQDKKAIDDQFERAFQLVEQLAKDTEALKASERERTERLDSALSDLETVINDLKSANKRREDEAQRIRDDVQGLRDSLPKALDAQKGMTDNRLRDVNTELKGLKTLLSQRMNPTPTSSTINNYLRPSSGNASPSGAGSVNTTGVENGGSGDKAASDSKPVDHTSSIGRSSPFSSGMPASKASIPAWQQSMAVQAASSTSRSSTPVATGAASGSGDDQ